MNCLSLCALLAFNALGDPAPDVVTKFYDLSAATPEVHGPMQVRVMPYLLNDYDESAGFDRHQPRDTIAEWVYTTFERELGYEGRSVEMAEDGRLRITAPETVHKQIAALVGFIEQTMQRSVELRVDWIERAPGSPAWPTFVPAAEVDAMIAASTKARSTTVQLHPGRAQILDATREIELLCDYGVEIAQAATIADPVVRAFNVGKRTVWLGSNTRGGVRLAVFLGDGVLNGPIRDTSVGLGGVITTERGPEVIGTRATLQSISVTQHALALAMFIPDGQAAVIEVGADLETASGRRAIVVRATGARKDPLSTFSFDGGKTQVQLIDATWTAAPRLQLSEGFFEMSTRSQREFLTIEYENIVEFGFGSTSALESELGSSGDRHVSSIGPWIFTRGFEDAPATAALTMAHAGFATTETPASAGLSITLRRGPRSLVMWNTPIFAGGSAVFSIGGETLRIRDADVEVAQSATSIDPKVDSRFDGLRGQFSCARGQDGSWSIDCTARAYVLAQPPTVTDSGSGLAVPIDLGQFDGLSITEKIVLGGQGGARKVILGGGGELQLEIELR